MGTFDHLPKTLTHRASVTFDQSLFSRPGIALGVLLLHVIGWLSCLRLWILSFVGMQLVAGPAWFGGLFWNKLKPPTVTTFQSAAFRQTPFNVLPRRPAVAAAELLGIAQPTLVAWAGALSGFKRHFVIRGSYSPGVDSCNGFPEGCAMSCVSMMILTQLFHRWLSCCNALFRPVSYVDNWAVILHNVDHMRQATDAVDRFAALLQIQLDAQKNFTWCTHPEGRKELRNQGYSVLLGTRELGAHVVYTKQLANKTTIERIQGLSDFWAKLSSTWCTFRHISSPWLLELRGSVHFMPSLLSLWARNILQAYVLSSCKLCTYKNQVPIRSCNVA
jgi:hypothetical protein